MPPDPPADALRDAQAYFAPRAAAYAASPTHANAEELGRMLRLLALPPGARALDVATGGGHTARALAGAGAAVVATDATAAMLALLRGSPVAGVLSDAHALPFAAESFDAVACRIAAHHFPDLPRFVGECARVLRPNGALYVFDLTTPEDEAAGAEVDRMERLRDPSHVRSWPPSAWRRALAAAGLAPERLDAPHSEIELEPWIARARMPPAREAELRRLLATPASARGGYGLTAEGRMCLLRVEILARKPA